MYCAKTVNGPYRKFHAWMQQVFLIIYRTAQLEFTAKKSPRNRLFTHLLLQHEWFLDAAPPVALNKSSHGTFRTWQLQYHFLEGNFTSTALLLGIWLAIQMMHITHLPILQFHERTWLSVCTCNQRLMFPLFSSEWTTNPVKSNNHPLLSRHFIPEWLKIQHHNYSSLQISLTQLFFMSRTVCMRHVTNFAADSPVSKFSINLNFSFLNSNCLKMVTYITVKIKG